MMWRDRLSLLLLSLLFVQCLPANADVGDDDFLLRAIANVFTTDDALPPAPISWTKSTFTTVPGLSIFHASELNDAADVIASSTSTPLVTLDLMAWCGLLRDYHRLPLDKQYAAMFLLNANVGLLSDEPWDPLRNVTIDERMQICTQEAGVPISRATVIEWLNSPQLTRFFVNQRTFAFHPKLTVIPLGVGPNHYDVFLNRHGLENILDVIKRLALEPSRKRKNRLAVNHSWLAGRDSIYEIVNQNFGGTLENHYCHDGDDAVNAKECTEQYRDDALNARFCLSPRGMGSDCYRHWESLLLGCIPVVESGPLDGMFDGLPVVFVNDWMDVSPAFLDRQWQVVRSKPITGDKRLTLEWHIQQVRESVKQR